jgi:hypothetical protein
VSATDRDDTGGRATAAGRVARGVWSAAAPAARELGLPFTVPGWALRVAFVVLAAVLAVTAGSGGPWAAVSIALAAVSAWVPRWRLAWLLIAVLAFAVLLEPETGVSVRVAALIAGAHALHVLAAWMLVVGPRARLHPAVLLPGVRRFVAIQLPVQAVALAAGLLRPGPGDGAFAVVTGAGILGIVALLGALLLWRPRP